MSFMHGKIVQCLKETDGKWNKSDFCVNIETL